MRKVHLDLSPETQKHPAFWLRIPPAVGFLDILVRMRVICRLNSNSILVRSLSVLTRGIGAGVLIEVGLVTAGQFPVCAKTNGTDGPRAGCVACQRTPGRNSCDDEKWSDDLLVTIIRQLCPKVVTRQGETR